MATYDEHILHGLDGQKCTCTLHDIGYNCQRAWTRDSLRREAAELVRVAALSGFDASEIRSAFTVAVHQHLFTLAAQQPVPDGAK